MFSTPLPGAVVGVHYDQSPSWGSQGSNENAAYGYIQPIKKRWTQQVREYDDPAALERFGIDPTKRTPQGVVTMADPFGFPVDGYTTGYTVKLPPPANFAAAEQTPRSFNGIGVVESGNGSDVGPPPVPDGVDVGGGVGYEPTNFRIGDQGWSYGDASGMQQTAAMIKFGKDLQDLINRSGLDPAVAAQALQFGKLRKAIQTPDMMDVVS
ncbi:MAG: hypothetical protein ACR2IJ_06025 [Fluviibacter sp.]